MRHRNRRGAPKCVAPECSGHKMGRVSLNQHSLDWALGGRITRIFRIEIRYNVSKTNVHIRIKLKISVNHIFQI